MEPRNCLLAHEQLVVAYTQKWPHQTSAIIANANFLTLVIKDDRCVNVDNTAVLFRLQHGVQFKGIIGNSYPRTVDKYLHLIKQLCATQCLNLYDMRHNVVIQRRRLAMNRNMCHITQILHNTYRLPLRSLCRTQVTPRSIVQLARRYQLSTLVCWCRNSPCVTQTASIGQTIQHLSNPNLVAIRMLDSKIARGKRALDPILNRV